VKVMGLRRGDEVQLTVATPLLAREVPDSDAYEAVKAEVGAAVLRFASRTMQHRAVRVEVNAADDPARGARYLTLTGTSAEMGDDGEVGRGNRVNGLIAPFRPASLEAAAGKNPISHVGKLYNLMALRGARRIVEGIPGVAEARVFLLSQIGRPLHEPLCAEAVVRMAGAALTAAVREEAARLLSAELADPAAIRRELRSGALPVY
jgi:S-adenosylmethionine synthetase